MIGGGEEFEARNLVGGSRIDRQGDVTLPHSLSFPKEDAIILIDCLTVIESIIA